MSNERLKAALTHAGVTVEELAEQVGVDAKTIERWISGRVPHRRNRLRLARALATTPDQLWPDHDPAPEPPAPPAEVSQDELVATYLGRRDPVLPDALELIGQATRQVDLLGLSLAALINAETVRRLAARAAAGVQIRVLLADPESVHVLAEHAEHDPHATVTTLPPAGWEIERTLGYLQPLLELSGVQVRLFTASRPNAILRADEQMLVALHLWGATPDHEPILHLEHRHDAGLFERFAHHLELVWTHASLPAPIDAELYPDPDQEPGRYQPGPPDSPLAMRTHAFGVTFPTDEDGEGEEVSSTPSSAPTSRRRRRR